MASRSDVISVDALWDIFDAERERAWFGVDAEPGTPEWDVAAGKIVAIGNICGSVREMNAAERSNADKAEPPVWKSGKSLVHTDYADGTADTRLNRWAAWTCPHCDWFVGEQFVPSFVGHNPHNQRKCNFCSRCGQRIDWVAVEGELTIKNGKELSQNETDD